MKTAVNTFFTIAILLLMAVPAYIWQTHEGLWDDFSITENRPLERFGTYWTDLKTSIKRVLAGDLETAYEEYFVRIAERTLQEQILKAAADQFPRRLNLIEGAKAYDRALISGTYGLTAMPAIPASLDTDYFILRDAPVFLLEPKQPGYVGLKTVENQAKNYSEIMKAFPNINFYVFYIERVDLSPVNPLNPWYRNLDMGSSFDQFLDIKPPRLEVSSMKLDSFEDHKILFYNTDHHWNIRGAWKGYSIIYNMLSQIYPEISPKLEVQEFRAVEGVDFCGSFARRTLYPCTPEPFEYAVVDLPPYRTWVDGEETAYGKRDAYLRGEFNNHPYTNHYSEFFGNVVDEVFYRFENGSERDLLIIGGSHSQAVQLYIAAHYRTTYVVDLRAFGEFDFSDAVEEYGIDDVLVLGDIIVYGRSGWEIKL